MTVEPHDTKRSLFTCKIGAKLNPFNIIASKLTALTFRSQAHADKETPHFADFAGQWATRND